jgi:hypothetical protein
MIVAKEKTQTHLLDELVVHESDSRGLFVKLKLHDHANDTLEVVVVRDMQRLTGKIKLRTLANALASALAEEQLDGPQG